jgi:small-conductance mechanosensitive channel
VLPNSVAASQVTINLTQSAPKSQIKITIRVNREADYEEVRRVALSVASETLGEKAAVGCFLTKVTSVRAIFELTAEVPESVDRDALRAKMLSRLAQRFAESNIDSKGQDRPSFS